MNSAAGFNALNVGWRAQRQSHQALFLLAGRCLFSAWHEVWGREDRDLGCITVVDAQPGSTFNFARRRRAAERKKVA